jgi:hypothetical protein
MDTRTGRGRAARTGSFLRNNAFGLIAIFISLGGTAYAVDTVRSEDVVNESLLSEDIQDGTLTGLDVSGGRDGLGSLGSADLATGSVGSSEVMNGSLNGADLGCCLSGQNHILDGSLTASDLASNSVGTDELQSASIGSDELKTNSVFGGEVVNDSLTGDDINELTLGPSSRAYVTSLGFSPARALTTSSFTGLVAKTVPNGSYLVTATVEGNYNTGASEGRPIICRIRGNNTSFGQTRIEWTHNLLESQITLVHWGSVSSTEPNNLFVECQGQDIAVRTVRMAATRLLAVG